ncbi:MAG: WYL domain-containing protein [Bacteroidaceae bacterium]|nr:WYL domain-containing protein [Bacteroidaceae bacterium]
MKIPSLFKEYIWLIETIKRNGRMTLGEISELWRQQEESDGQELSRTTFNRHRDSILDIFGVIIECDRKDGYRYYIENEEVLKENSIQNWMFSTLSVSNMLDGNAGLQDRILLESIPSGGDKLRQIIDAMRDNRRIRIQYHKYTSSESKPYTLEPYCLKLYNRRWYMLVKKADAPTPDDDTKKGDLFIFSLDRIESIELLQTKFVVDKNFDAEAYFNDCFGIMVDSSLKAERVVLRAYGLTPYYLRDLPMHHSQKEIKRTEEYTDYEYKLRPAEDFIEQLLSLSTQVRVMEPAWLAKELQHRLWDALSLYKEK